ncbi:protein ABHD14A [Phascolarctos cinereus]|uniref:Protein ABHD14A n=1 Tax=Phascolarctos cinereus TaxID=38626 RepID=A0A6P5LG52_PHACI|nr:protein ABHD14A [Phascolarctos cinereus]XP_020854580.1 protein ABHD14A [Phascolarctos cinereus]XP_020854581.1 protein ABHD14A [Phascolarctos cinereus]XP_020854582.1 protein ABHD14A [Phascolarctos cinereus]XP_020854583.1 protein ABHD14A [Phascolarctos cinereus]XP_020854584.1 protein ABHD14A [Phascolarctos cinereus]XP_020854585.1 protein ABHD14A [Phascolarctos cinereus]
MPGIPKLPKGVLLALGLLLTILLYLGLPGIPQPLIWTWDNDNVTMLAGLTHSNSSVFYREVQPLHRRHRIEVVLLHGKAFTSHIWQQLGTLEKLSRRGYRAIALDLPGFGNSFPSPAASTEAGRADLLDHILRELEVKNLVLVSPSLSGLYSLPFLMRAHQQLCGFVPIAPTFTENYTQKQFSAIKTPTLIIYGALDKGLAQESLQKLRYLPNHSTVKLQDAGHACYLHQPHDFHDALLTFLDKLS